MSVMREEYDKYFILLEYRFRFRIFENIKMKKHEYILRMWDALFSFTISNIIIHSEIYADRWFFKVTQTVV